MITNHSATNIKFTKKSTDNNSMRKSLQLCKRQRRTTKKSEKNRTFSQMV